MKNIFKRVFKATYKFLANKNIRQLLFLYLRWYGYERHKKVENIKVLGYKIDTPDMASFLGQFREIFVDDNYKFIAKSDEPVIYDCGANIGLSCLYFKSLYPKAKITAFEADKNIAEILSINLNNNNIKDVIIVDSAVWIHDDGVEFVAEGSDGGSIQGSGSKNKIPSVRLKGILEKSKRKIDLLKIDIEGAEYEVIKDCEKSLDNVKNIFIEYHSWNNSPQKLSEILSVLEKNNFRYFINGICGRPQPFVNKGTDQNMDLQLNIFGIKRN
jgi:FkbM family methyltransferase